MAKSQKPTDTQIIFTKAARILTYLIYAYTLVAVTFLSLGFVMLLFGANPNAPFSKFIYNVAIEFMAPFRGIFPTHQVSETGYFSASALFAIIIYFIIAMALHALITYITSKIIKHETELEEMVSTK
mgnify:FL=1